MAMTLEFSEAPPAGASAPWRRLRRIGLAAAPWSAALALWYGLWASGWIAPGLLPAPHEVLRAAWTLSADGSYPAHIVASVARVAAGVCIGVALAAPIGMALGLIAAARTALGPGLNFLRALPPIALVPLVIIYLGIGEVAKITVLSFSAFFAATVVIAEGVSHTPPLFLQAARTLGANRRELFLRVILPMATPHILTAVRLALGVCWATLVAAELVAAQTGLGAMIQIAAAFFQVDVIYLGIVTIGLCALTMDWAARRVGARLTLWREAASA